MSDNGENGGAERVVRASRRADGTFRKERKIRDGYVPPDEQVAYVSRGQQFRRDVEKAGVPGFDASDQDSAKPMSKSAKKNAARKAKKATETDIPSDHHGTSVASGRVNGEPAAPGHTGGQASQQGAQCQGASEESSEKRARALHKKIRQITELRDKQAGGAELTPEQTVKLNSLQSLQDELAALNLK